MGVFGFIENFFFISLGIAFALVLLLVYHFKNRMSVAEKKSETMYGLLSSVVREIKSLRSMFGVNPVLAKYVPLDMDIVKKKSEPEVPVSAGSEPEVITVNLASSPTNVKIVVSDEEDEDEDEDEEYSEDEESESEDEDESEDEEETEDEKESEDEESESEDDEMRVEDLGSDLVLESTDIGVDEIETVSNLELEEDVSNKKHESTADISVVSEHNPDELVHEEEPSSIVPPKQSHSIEQLKKMNINQLKTIAIQSGITVDTSKLKKHDLITLIVDA